MTVHTLLPIGTTAAVSADVQLIAGETATLMLDLGGVAAPEQSDASVRVEAKLGASTYAEVETLSALRGTQVVRVRGPIVFRVAREARATRHAGFGVGMHKGDAEDQSAEGLSTSARQDQIIARQDQILSRLQTIITALQGSTTAHLLHASAPGQVSGATHASFENTGATPAQVAGAALAPGGKVEFHARPGGALSPIAFDGTGTELVIAYTATA